MTSWTAPHRSLQIVAFLLILVSAAAFAFGLAGNLQRGGHLPGAQILSGVTGAPVEAEDATPLSNERIEGPPKAEEEKKPAGNEDADEEDQPDEDQPVGNAAPVGNAVAAGNATLPAAGNAAESQAPPPEEPPH